jgi:hypothetical protein
LSGVTKVVTAEKRLGQFRRHRLVVVADMDELGPDEWDRLAHSGCAAAERAPQHDAARIEYLVVRPGVFV